MKHYLRFILLLSIVVTCTIRGLTQDANPRSKGLSAPAPQIETSYDQVKNITTVRLAPMQIYGEPLTSSSYRGASEARIYASFTYPGRTLTAPPKRVLFSLISTAVNWKYTDFHQLTAEVDGKHLKLDALEHVPSFSVGDYVRQEIAVSLPYETYLRIATGKKVHIRMGPRKLRLGENHLLALRALARQMIPPAPM